MATNGHFQYKSNVISAEHVFKPAITAILAALLQGTCLSII